MVLHHYTRFTVNVWFRAPEHGSRMPILTFENCLYFMPAFDCNLYNNIYLSSSYRTVTALVLDIQ